MALKLGIKITTSELLRHLVLHDPGYSNHLTTLLEPIGWSFEEYYQHVEKWDLSKLGLAREVVAPLRDEACHPKSVLLGPADNRQLEQVMDTHEVEYLAYHVLGTEDGTLNQAEMLDWYNYAVDIFNTAKLPIEKLVWFCGE